MSVIMGDEANALDDMMEAKVDEMIAGRCAAGFWTQKNGKMIRIRNMDVRHLKNTIRLLEGTGDHYGYLPQMREELSLKWIYE